MTDDEREIRSLVQRWMGASAAGDTKAVLDMMTDNVVFMVPGREPFGKEAFADQSAAQNDMKIDGKADTVEVKMLGDGWAYMRNHFVVTITPKGAAAVRREGYTLTVLRKGDDGKWRLARDANLLAAKS